MTTKSLIIMIAVVLFILYRRGRRLFGWQPMPIRYIKFRRWLIVPGALLLLAIVASTLLAKLSLSQHLLLILLDVICVAAGVTVSYFAIRTLRFEQRNNLWYYRANAAFGIALFGLILLRIGLKFASLSQMAMASGAATQSNAQLQSFTSDPLTIAPLLIFISYQLVFRTYILFKSLKLRSEI